MEQEKHWVEVPTYHDLAADIPALEAALKRLQAYIDNAQSEHMQSQRLRQAWHVLARMVDAGQITLDSTRFVLVDEFSVANFSRRAPSYASDNVIFEIGPSIIKDEVGNLSAYGIGPKMAEAMSAIYAPFRYRPVGSLDERVMSAHYSPDFFGLSLEFLFRRDVKRAAEYMQRAVAIRNTVARQAIIENNSAIRLVVDNSEQMDKVRVAKYGLPSLLERVA